MLTHYFKIHQLEKGTWPFGGQKHLLILKLKVHFIFFPEIISNLQKCYKNYTKYSHILHTDPSSIDFLPHLPHLFLILYLYMHVYVYIKKFSRTTQESVIDTVPLPL